MEEKSATEQIDAIIKMYDDWRGSTLAALRAVILHVDPSIIEAVKWKKPSKPEGVAVWMRDGNICIGEILKSAVRLTFPTGARLQDPAKLFNTRLDSKTVRAIDVHKDETINEGALTALIREAIS
jgi:hypothetical protein